MVIGVTRLHPQGVGRGCKAAEAATTTHYTDQQIGESATHPIARILGRPALLFLLAWNDHATSSRLAGQPKIRTLECVQLRFLG